MVWWKRKVKKYYSPSSSPHKMHLALLTLCHSSLTCFSLANLSCRSFDPLPIILCSLSKNPSCRRWVTKPLTKKFECHWQTKPFAKDYRRRSQRRRSQQHFIVFSCWNRQSFFTFKIFSFYYYYYYSIIFFYLLNNFKSVFDSLKNKELDSIKIFV